MIDYSRHGKQVRASIEIDVPGYEERILYFYWNCDNEIFAGLLASELQRQQDNNIIHDKREAYLQGYKDGRAKRAKQTFFSRLF